MVIRGVPGIVVRVATEQISFVTFFRFMMELKVVLCELNLLSGGTGSNFMGLSPICEILMVSLDYDG